MEINRIGLPYFIQDIHQHEEAKSILLEMIDKEEEGYEDKDHSTDHISKTDYDLDRKDFLEYQDYYVKNIFIWYRQQISEILGMINKMEEILPSKIWFQQYEEGDQHGMHIHPFNHWSSVYYLELPNNNYKTKFYNFGEYGNMEEMEVNVKEGQMITFPCQIKHKSPMIKDGKRKTVIVTNHTFHNTFHKFRTS